MKYKIPIILIVLSTALAVYAVKTNRMSAGPSGFGGGTIPNMKYGLPGYFSKLQPKIQKFTVSAASGGKITGQNGVRVTLPGNAFGVKTPVQVEMLEVIHPLDYLIAGIPMYTVPSEGGHALNSGGMVRLRFYSGGREIQPNQKIPITLQFPDMFPQSRFKGYSLVTGEGFKTISEDVRDSRELEFFDEGIESMGVRVLDIFGGGFINLDYPEPELTCLKGTMSGGKDNSPFQVAVLGINHRSYFTSYEPTGPVFRINALKLKGVKVLIMQAPDFIGISDLIVTSDKTAFDKDYRKGKDECTDISEIKVTKVDKKLLDDREALAAFLDLPNKTGNVTYID